MPYLVPLLALAVFLAVVLLIAYICFRMAFLAVPQTPLGPDEYSIPDGEIYEPHRDRMIAWMKEVRLLPCRDFLAQSFDGLTLYGKYYECAPGAPIELMFHGYRGNAERDLCGGVQRCFRLGRNVLLVDQRTAGRSDGNVITFGINEHRDCLTWIDVLINHFGPDVQIILTGISMGAATVVMAAGNPLPKNVVGVLADCGYSSPKEIIQKVIRDMKLPPTLAYPFVRLGAKLFGHFDLEDCSPLQAAARSNVPILFVHGENDDFVPCEMSHSVYDACASHKGIATFPGAGHGLSYLVDPEGYLQTLRDFFDPLLEQNSQPHK